MDNKQLYLNDILQTDPVFSNEYLSEILQLPANSTIATKTIIEDRTTDTTRIIRLLITWKDINEGEKSKNLFLKLPIITNPENAFDKWSMHEIDFYVNVSNAEELPIPKFVDGYISDDRKSFLLALEDISSDYFSAIEVNRNEMGNWHTAAESLARFHSRFWNGINADRLNPLNGDNKPIEEKIKNYQEALAKFLPYASEYYDNDILSAYNAILEDAILFERRSQDRREKSSNISVIHGDSHIFNFMYPKASIHRPLMMDFQFWRIGIPTIDLMNLTRVAFPFKDEPDSHLEVLKHYHSALLGFGVTNYSCSECLQDYYLSEAISAFGPVFNYVDFGLGHEYWGQGVYDTINNYKTVKKLVNLPL